MPTNPISISPENPGKSFIHYFIYLAVTVIDKRIYRLYSMKTFQTCKEYYNMSLSNCQLQTGINCEKQIMRLITTDSSAHVLNK